MMGLKGFEGAILESISSVLGTCIIPAHVVPGVLYLYVFNKVCRIGDLPWPGLLMGRLC